MTTMTTSTITPPPLYGTNCRFHCLYDCHCNCRYVTTTAGTTPLRTPGELQMLLRTSFQKVSRSRSQCGTHEARTFEVRTATDLDASSVGALTCKRKRVVWVLGGLVCSVTEWNFAVKLSRPPCAAQSR